MRNKNNAGQYKFQKASAFGLSSVPFLAILFPFIKIRPPNPGLKGLSLPASITS